MRGATAPAKGHEHGPGAAGWPEAAVLAGLLGAGLALRLFHLGAASFWFDEAASVLASRTGGVAGPFPLPEPPGWTLCLRAWWLLPVPPTEWWARLPAALAGALVAPLTWLVARRWLDPAGAFIAAVLAAASPVGVLFSQECRMYSLLAALGLAALLALARSRPAAYAVTVAAGGCLHPGFLFALPAHAVAAMAEPPRRSGRGLVLAALAGAVPGIVLALLRSRDLGWVVAHPLEPALPWGGLGLRALELAGPGPRLAGALRLTGLMAFAATALAGLAALRTGPRVVLASLVGLPLAVLQALARMGLVAPPQLRYVIGSQPLFLVACAAGCARLGPRWRWAALGCLLAVNGASLRAMSAGGPFGGGLMAAKKPLRDVAAFVRSRARPGDAIVHVSMSSAIPFRLYLPEWPDQPYLLADPSITPAETRWLGEARPFGVAVAGARRVWLVVSPVLWSDPPAVPAALGPELERRCRPPIRWEFPGVEVYLAPVRGGAR